MPVSSAHSADNPCRKSQLGKIKNDKVCTKITKYRYAWKSPVIKIQKGFNEEPSKNSNSKDNIELSSININNFESFLNVYIWDKANSDIDSYKTNFIPHINIIVSPNVDVSRIKEQELLLKKSISLWSEIYAPQKITPWFFVYKDKIWLQENIQRKEIISNVMNHFFQNPNFCSFGGVWNSIENNRWVSKNEMYLCIDKGSEQSFYKHHIGHEYVHIVQGYSAYRENLPPPYSYQLMCWAFEGIPTFYGIATSDIDNSSRVEFYSKSISAEFKKISKSKDLIKKWLIDNTVSIPNCPGRQEDIYVVGSLVTELLVATSGHKDIMKFHSKRPCARAPLRSTSRESSTTRRACVLP